MLNDNQPAAAHKRSLIIVYVEYVKELPVSVFAEDVGPVPVDPPRPTKTPQSHQSK